MPYNDRTMQLGAKFHFDLDRFLKAEMLPYYKNALTIEGIEKITKFATIVVMETLSPKDPKEPKE